MKSEKKDLITIDEAIGATREQAREWFDCVNPTLNSLLAMMNFDRRYVKAEGIFVWDDEGQRYLDFFGGYGAVNHGHNHPNILAAIEMIKELPKVLQVTSNPLAGALAKNLAAITPGQLEISFFCNSGAEAVEGALKLARAATGKKEFISTENSFHGKTFGALSVTGREKYQRPFEPLLPGCRTIPFGDSGVLEQELRHRDVAAFIVEPIQGEGGVIIPPDGYLKGAEELCRKHKALLIVDEAQTGFGRTGKMFACEHENVEPDILCLSKSLGGGMVPLGAYVTTRKVWMRAYGSLSNCLLHTSTFGNNTLACAVGLAAIQTAIDENLPESARENGQYFLERLKGLQERHAMIKEARGRGLMIGIEFYEPAQGFLSKATGGVVNKLSKEYFSQMVVSELLNEYRILTVYTLNNPNVVRLQPPLVVEKEHLDFAVEALDNICQEHKGVWRMAIKTAKGIDLKSALKKTTLGLLRRKKR